MISAKVIELEHYAGGTFRLRTERPAVPIQAGQCFNLGLPGSGVNREYSMYSDARAPYIDFLIKEVDGGCVSPMMRQLHAGDLVEVEGPYGKFCLNPPIDGRQPYLFLASGTGIAPFHSFVESYPDLNYKLLHGIRHAEEQYDASHYKHGRYIPCISRNTAGCKSTRVTDFLRDNPVSPQSIVYLCGNRNMIIDAFEILREQGVSGDNLFTEVFF